MVADFQKGTSSDSTVFMVSPEGSAARPLAAASAQTRAAAAAREEKVSDTLTARVSSTFSSLYGPARAR